MYLGTMITKPSEKKLFLLDAFALIFRAYYAFIRSPRINSKGWNTSASFGFTNAMLEVIRSEKPTHLAVVFDPPGPNFRHDTFPEYKANREATPEDIKASVPRIIELLEAMHIPVIREPGFEADDMIGYLARLAAEQDFEVYMMTPDKDFGQLVTEKVKMYRPGRSGNPPEIWGPAEVCERFGLTSPEQMIDYLGLMGDSADNIPGIPGVGPKTASKLLADYGTLEGVLAHGDELKGKLRERVEGGHASALMSKELATIVTDIPYEPSFEAMAMVPPNAQALAEVLDRLEFRTLTQRVGNILPSSAGQTASVAAQTTSPASVAENAGGQIDMFSAPVASVTASAAAAPKLEQAEHSRAFPASEVSYALAANPTAIAQMLQAVGVAERVAFHPITTGEPPMGLCLLGMAVASEPGKGWYLPVAGEHEKSGREALAAVLTLASEKGAVHDSKPLMHLLKSMGMEVPKELFDVHLAHYVLKPDMRHGQAYLADVLLNCRVMPEVAVLGGHGKSRRQLEDVAPEDMVDYAMESADLTFRLAAHMQAAYASRIDGKDIEIFEQLETPLIPVLVAMEHEGIRLDVEHLRSMAGDLTGEITQRTAAIVEAAGQQFNVDSPSQLGEILFDTLEISTGKKKPKKTKTGKYSTSEDVLSKLTDAHPIVEQVLEYRTLKKLLSTYLEPLPELVNAQTGRIHSQFMQAVASTGRLSSIKPNLQNIPIRTPQGRKVREAFVPRDTDHVLMAADYSQVELRIVASLSKDRGMVQAFKSGQDIHAATAAKVFGVELDAVSREQRSQAKAVNFGILYGQGAFGLAENLNISRKEAKQIIESYFAQFADLKAYQDASLEEARQRGYVQTLMGRKRWVPDLTSANPMVRSFAERNAINAPVQGSAADIIKVAMIRIQGEIERRGLASRMILQVHDELVFDVPRSELEELKKLVRGEMEGAAELDVPLVVDVQTGENWLEAH